MLPTFLFPSHNYIVTVAVINHCNYFQKDQELKDKKSELDALKTEVGLHS